MGAISRLRSLGCEGMGLEITILGSGSSGNATLVSDGAPRFPAFSYAGTKSNISLTPVCMFIFAMFNINLSWFKVSYCL